MEAVMRLGLVFTTVAAGLTLAACATAEGYRQQMSGYVGYPADYLILELGSPVARDVLSDGSEVWSFHREERYYYPGGYRTEPRQRRISYRGRDGEIRTRVEHYDETVYDPPYEHWAECETRFVVRDGIVTDFRFDGGACVAPEVREG
jgi:hypothetical protein